MMDDRIWDLIYWAGGAILVWWVICAVLALATFVFVAYRFIRVSREVDRQQREMRDRMQRRW